MRLKLFLLLGIVFLVLTNSFSLVSASSLVVWHEPVNPKAGDLVNIYANISFDCFNKIQSKFRVNDGNWQTIWNGGWQDCQTNLTNFLLNHNNSNLGKSLGPFNKGDAVEYSVAIEKDGNILQTVNESFEIKNQEKNLQQYIWIFSLAIILILILISKKLRPRK